MLFNQSALIGVVLFVGEDLQNVNPQMEMEKMCENGLRILHSY